LLYNAWLLDHTYQAGMLLGLARYYQKSYKSYPSTILCLNKM
jgi:hypothetical protein